IERLRRFASEVAEHRDVLVSLLHHLRSRGSRVVAVSAPAKGSTLLNYCRLGPETVEYVTEKTALKIGRFTPGTHVPVVPDERLLTDRPDFALLLAWNFANEIMANLSEFEAAGGRFVIPIPEPRVVERGRELTEVHAR
ncbi:MAG TPA: methyltransferase C-terminal domain-containing protein, partial [Gaiellaceae bacterium]|nr:methyltransferase C-terminal domain-containing protein [Gaiellaceae bacterium]